MSKNLGTPWNFRDPFHSPNGRHVLEYEDVGEVVMSGPMSGGCFLIVDGQKYKLAGSYGGPAIWNETSEKIAVPYWTHQRTQKLAIIDLNSMTLRISEKEFRVIELSEFVGSMVKGIDSPAHNTKEILFDIQVETYEQEIKIQAPEL